MTLDYPTHLINYFFPLYVFSNFSIKLKLAFFQRKDPIFIGMGKKCFFLERFPEIVSIEMFEENPNYL